MEDDDIKRLRCSLEDVLSDKDTDASLEDYFALSKESYDTFNAYSYATKNGYECPDFPFFNAKMEGLTAGLYLFAARANSGKTALMTNLLWSYCRHEPNHLFCVYYSLDDSRNDVIPRMMSMIQQIPITVCAKPQRYIDVVEALKKEEESLDTFSRIEDYENLLAKRELALEELKQNANKFYIVDSKEIDSFEKLISHAQKVQTYVKSLDPENNIIIGVDSVFDLTFSKKKFHSKDEESREISMTLKRLAESLDVPIFGSCHLKKKNDKRRPIQDDLKDSGRFQYDAKAIFLLYNDVSENKLNASVYYGQSPDIQPVIEIDWSKNKASSFKGMSYCYFQPDYSYVQECTKEDQERYLTLMYSAS